MAETKMTWNTKLNQERSLSGAATTNNESSTISPVKAKNCPTQADDYNEHRLSLWGMTHASANELYLSMLANLTVYM